MPDTDDQIPAARPSVEELTEMLSAPFDPKEVKFKPAVVSGNRALALAYVDARVIQDRLDDVLGIAGWQDEYECLPDGSVVCRLRLRFGAEWITKMDVGGQSEQPDEGDRRKAAFSDALKRTAVKFGVGRYLYRLPQLWCDYDPQKRQFTKPPALPSWALPRPATTKENGQQTKSDPARTANALPTTGAELHERVLAHQLALVKSGACAEGELVNHLLMVGSTNKYPPLIKDWRDAQIAHAVEEVKAFMQAGKTKVQSREVQALNKELERIGLTWGKVLASQRAEVQKLRLGNLAVNAITFRQYSGLLAILQPMPAKM